jgi:hypothetical protein
VTSSDPRSTPTNPGSHPAFKISCALGAVGLVLIFIGLIVGGSVVFDVGIFFGFGSLVAALAWRADLVSSWRRQHPRRSNSAE